MEICVVIFGCAARFWWDWGQTVTSVYIHKIYEALDAMKHEMHDAQQHT